VARARDISNRKTLSPETVRRMHAFFSRHEKNKAGGEDDAGYIAWLLWGGDSGQSWAKRKVDQMNKQENGMSDIYKAIAERLGSAARNARPGAKARMAAGEPDLRSFRLPGEIADVRKKINDYTRALENDLRSGKYTTAAARCKAIGAMYGPGGGSLSWFYEEYADALKNRGYARSGNKTKFAQPPFSASDLNALKRLVQQYDQKAKTSKGVRTETGMNAEWEAISIANHLREIVGYAQVGQTHRAYAQVRMSSPDVVRILPASLVKAAQEVTKLSRPGAKAKFAFKVGDRVHAGFGVAGGAGVVGTITKIEDGYAHIQADASASDRYGPKTHKAPLRLVTAAPKKAWESSRPGAKAKMGKQWREGPYAFKNKLLAEDQMQLLVNEGSGWMNAGVFMDESDTIEASKSYVQMRKRGFVYEHGQWNKARASRPGAKDTNAVREGCKISAEDEACLKMMAAADEKVSDKIRTLIAEGKPQKQAVAIALDLKRRGEL
jgi:hypothetical protein